MKLNKPSKRNFRVNEDIQDIMQDVSKGLTLSKTLIFRAAFNVGLLWWQKNGLYSQELAVHNMRVKGSKSSVSTLQITLSQAEKASKLKCADSAGYSAACRVCLFKGFYDLQTRKLAMNDFDFSQYVLLYSFDEIQS